MKNVIKTFEKFFNNDVFNIINEKYFSSDFLEVNIMSGNGYTVKDDKVIFGCRLTYEPDLSYLFHEMGHFVYFKDYSRLLKSSYGLTYPKIDVFGVDYDHTTNWTDIKNEAKVCCFQYMLLKIYEPNIKLDDFIYDWVRSLNLLNGFMYVPVKNAYMKDDGTYKYYDNDSNELLSYNERNKRKEETIYDFFIDEHTKSIYNIKEFDNRWFDRVKYIEKNL